MINNFLIFYILFALPLFCASYVVDLATDSSVGSGGSSTGATSGELRYVLNQILNDQALGVSSGSHTITFTVPGVTLEAIMPPINLFASDAITIGNSAGDATVIDGGGAYRPFFIESGSVNIRNMVLQNCLAQGGSAEGGGGGGLGGGGAIFVDGGTVTVSNVAFSSNGAAAGIGVTAEGGNSGGGGLGGDGGTGGAIGGGGGGGYSGIGGEVRGGGGAVADGGSWLGGFNGGGGGGGAIIGAVGGSSAAGSTVSGYVFGGGGCANQGGGGTNPGSFDSALGGGGGYNGSTSTGGIGGGGGASLGSSVIGLGGNGGVGGGGGGATGIVGSVGSPGIPGQGGDGDTCGAGGGATGGNGPAGLEGVFPLPGGAGGTGTGGTGGFAGGGGAGRGGDGGLGANGSMFAPNASAGGSGGNGTGGNGGFGGGGGTGRGGNGAAAGTPSGGGASAAGGSGGNGTGGNGGFGAGGGAGAGGSAGAGSPAGTPGTGTAGAGGIGGSASPSSTKGGDGAAFGGAIFVNTGNLIIAGNTATSSSSLSANGGDGATAGSDLFIKTGASLTFSPSIGETVTLTGSIADDSVTSIPGASTWTPGDGAGASLLMNGAGNLVLSGGSPNTYVGMTTVSAGTLSLNKTGVAAIRGDLTISGGAVSISSSTQIPTTSSLILDGGSFDMEGNSISLVSLTMNSGSLTQGGGTLTLSDPATPLTMRNVTIPGPLVLSGGGDLVFDAANNGTAVISGSLDLDGNTTTFNIGNGSAAVDMEIEGAIENGGVVKEGAGNLTLSGSNSYAGATDIVNGALSLGAANALPSSTALSLSGATALFNLDGNAQEVGSLSGVEGAQIALGSGTLTFGSAGGSASFSGTISGTGGITKIGAGDTTLSGASANTFSGLTTVSAGSLILDKTDAAAISGGLAVSGGTVVVSSSAQIASSSALTLASGEFDMGGNSLNLASFTYHGGTLTQGASTLSLNSAGAALSMRNTTISGPVHLTGGGSVVFDSSNNGTATVNGALDLGGNTTAFNIGNGSAAIDMNLAGGVANGAVQKTGTGTLGISAACTYTGATAISSGTLATLASNVLPVSTAVSLLNSGAALDLQDSSQTIGSLSGVEGSTVALGSAALSLGGSNASTTFAGSIEGTGGIVKTGSGTFTISGNNSYTGSTEIAAGALSLGAANALPSSTSLSLSGATALFNLDGNAQEVGSLSGVEGAQIALGSGTLIFGSAGGSASFSGTISGTGGITKVGAGDTTLSGASANTFSGLTTVSAGSLILDKTDAAAISGSLAVSGGTVVVSSSVQIASSSALTLASGEFDMGGNSLNLASFTYQGGTLTQGASTLSLNSAGAALSMRNTTISGPVHLTGGGSVVFDSSSNGTATVNGALDLGGNTTAFNIGNGSAAIDMNLAGGVANGAVQKTGAGTLGISAACTYAGATAISSGTLATLASNVLPVSTAVSLSNSGAALALQDNSQTVGSLTGVEGSIVALGTGNLSFGSSGASTAFAGTLTGSGSLTKLGEGVFTLSGTSPDFSGNTFLNEGTLVVTGSLSSSSCTVADSAVLKGTGSLGAVTVDAGGSIIPGTSIGTLIIEGDLTLSPDSITSIEIDDTGAASLLDVRGDALLNNGILVIVPHIGNYAQGTTWEILTTGNGAGNVTGNFTFVPPDLIPSLAVSYSATGVFLILPEDSLIGLSLLGLPKNTLVVAQYLNTLVDVPQYFDSLTTISLLPKEQEISAINSISPLRAASSRMGLLNTQLSLNDLVSSRMDQQLALFYFPSPQWSTLHTASQFEETFRLIAGKIETLADNRAKRQPYCLWGQGFAFHSNEDGENTNPSFGTTSSGLFAGFDVWDGKSLYVGTGAGYARTYVKQGAAGSSVSNSEYLSFYANWLWNCWTVDTALWGSYSRVQNQRAVSFPGFSNTAEGSFNSWGVSPHLGAGYLFLFSKGGMNPFVSLDWPIQFNEGFEETGASPFNMNVAFNRSSLLRSEFGFRLYEKKEWDWGILIVNQSLSYIYKRPFSIGLVNAALVGQPGNFSVETFETGQNLVSPKIGFLLQWKQGIFCDFRYQGEFGDGYIANEFIVELGASF